VQRGDHLGGDAVRILQVPCPPYALTAPRDDAAAVLGAAGFPADGKNRTTSPTAESLLAGTASVPGKPWSTVRKTFTVSHGVDCSWAGSVACVELEDGAFGGLA
jgi:hypothetical protein